jgi:hypothetical protein
LQDVGEVRAGHDLLATGADGFEREELLRGAGSGEADAWPGEGAGGRRLGAGGGAFEEAGPVERMRSGAGAAHGDEAAAAYLAGDEAFGFEELVGGGDRGTVQAK